MEAMRAARGKQRVAAWAEAAADVAALPPDEAAAMFLSTTLGYADAPAKRAAEDALKQALQRADFAPALLTALCSAPLRSGGDVAHVLLRWTALLAPHIDAASAAFTKLAAVQSSLLATLTTGTARGRRRVP
jgi:hypothetical protein